MRPKQKRILFYPHNYAALNAPARHRTSRPVPPNVDPTTGEISEPRTHKGSLKESALINLLGPREPRGKRRPALGSRRLLKPYTDHLAAIIFAVIFAVVLLLGFLTLGSNLNFGYTADPVPCPPYEWMNDK